MADKNLVPQISDPRALAGKSPIREDESGEVFRDSAEFEELEVEFRKMEVDGPSAVNWKFLNVRTLEVLQTRSKDLVLATRLAYGLFLEESFVGLAIGVKVLADMADTHWDAMVPPVRRERGRVGAYDWFAEKLGLLVEGEKPEGEQAIAALQAHESLLELDSTLEQKLTKSQVALGPLIRALRPIAKDARAALEGKAGKKAEEGGAAAAAAEAGEQAQDGGSAQVSEGDERAGQGAGQGTAEPAAVSAAQQSTPEAAPRSTPQPQQQSAPPAAGAAPEIAVDGASDASFSSVFNAAGKLASASRKQAPEDPRGYLCSRFAFWGRVNMLPPASGGKTSLPPPQKAKMAELQALKGAGNHLALLDSAEGAFASSPFWLDSQLLICEAMKQLGEEFDDARAAIQGQLAGFLTRFPGLLDLVFNDGTPFASAEARGWIAEEVSVGGGGGAPMDPLITLASDAAGLAQAGKVGEGLGLLKAYCESCRSERDWFRAQMKLSEFCLRFDVLQPVIAQLASLRDRADKQDLATWEPDLVVELARLSWLSLNHKNIKQVISDNDLLILKSSVMEKLAILDIKTAAELAGKR